MPLCRATMSLSWHTDSPALENPIPWGLLAPRTRIIPGLWVGEYISICFLAKNKADFAPGVIPRAGTALFEKLAGPPSLNRNGSSGLRSPTRYSTNSLQTLQSLAKASENKNWQMKATYVEVIALFLSVEQVLIQPFRSTTSNYEIY